MLKNLLALFYGLILIPGFGQPTDQQTDSLLRLIQIEDTDSLKAKLYIELSDLNAFSHPSLTIEYAKKALEVSKRIQHNKLIADSYQLLFMGHYYQGSPADSILSVIKKLEDHVFNSGDEEYLMRTYWMYAMYFDNVHQPDKELEYFLKALEIVRKNSGDPDIETGLLHNIGSILLEQGKHKEAMQYFLDGLESVKGLGLKADLLYGSGLVYNLEGQFEEGLSNIRQAHELYEQVKDKGKSAMTLVEEGKYYGRKQQFEAAEIFYFKALELVEVNEVKYFLPEVLVAIALHYQQRNNFQKAIQFGERALQEIKSQSSFNSILETYTNLQESYAAVGNFEEAYRLRGEQMVYQDSISSIELLTKVEALQTQFEVEQKETENNLLKAEAAATQKTIQSKNITLLASLLGLLLIGSWALLVFRSNRQKQRYNEKLEATVEERTADLQKLNKELEQANKELKMFNYIASHNIKEPIRNIGSYAGFMSKKLPNDIKGEFEPYLEIIKKSTSQLYTLVEDVSKYTQLSNGEGIEIQSVDLNQVVEVIEMSLHQTLEAKNGRIINLGLPILKSSSSLLHTILKNIIENGLKFNQSSSPTIRLSTRVLSQGTEIIIEDNGIGIEAAYQGQIFEMFKRLHNQKEYQGSGIGLAIVKLLLDKLGGSLRIESELGKGSKFILQIPS